MNEIINILQNWTNVQIIVGCLTFGYVLKHYVAMDSKHIPLIMAVLGVFLSFALNGFKYVSFETTIIGGALSGLASTGLHQVFAQYIHGNDKNDNDKQPEYFDLYKGGE